MLWDCFLTLLWAVIKPFLEIFGMAFMEALERFCVTDQRMLKTIETILLFAIAATITLFATLTDAEGVFQ